ncbi:MAG TPA: GNAT family N-acetyltransferase [Acidobacteriaceae bacterium]
MRLRGFQADDIDAMHALDVVCFERPFRFTRGAMRRFATVKKARVVIAAEGDALVGFVILHIEEGEEGRTGYIITLDVEPAMRRRGIAGSLMRETERQARVDGCTALVLHVFVGNEAAIRFYEYADFSRSHLAEEFYGPGSDAWVCHKLLLPLEEQGEAAAILRG